MRVDSEGVYHSLRRAILVHESYSRTPVGGGEYVAPISVNCWLVS